MALNNSGESIQAKRRELVARLRLRGMTQRQIQATLAKPDRRTGTSAMVNPKTDEPFSLGTINSDCQFLDNEWRECMAEETDLLKSRIWAEIQEVRREAWASGDMGTVLKAIKQEVDLFGLNAPIKTDLTTGGRPITTIEVIRGKDD